MLSSARNQNRPQDHNSARVGDSIGVDREAITVESFVVRRIYAVITAGSDFCTQRAAYGYRDQQYFILKLFALHEAKFKFLV
ncbi:MAG: hypothetical protein ACKO2P_08335 [Planctomycetota bacterium]